MEDLLLPGTRIYTNFYPTPNNDQPQQHPRYVAGIISPSSTPSPAPPPAYLVAVVPSTDTTHLTGYHLEDAGRPFMVPAHNLISQDAVQLYRSWVLQAGVHELQECIQSAVEWRRRGAAALPPHPDPDPSDPAPPILPVLPRGSRVAIIGGGSAGVYALREAQVRTAPPSTCWSGRLLVVHFNQTRIYTSTTRDYWRHARGTWRVSPRALYADVDAKKTGPRRN